METEWQFIADDLAAVRTWLDTHTPDAFEVSAQPEREQHDEYWDTAGWLVWRAGFACRVRRRGEAAELTLKALSGGDAHMRRRIELNEPIDALGGLAGNIARPAGEAGRLLRTLAGPHPLARVAALTTHRTTLTLADGAGPLGEVSLDRTTVGEGSRAHELQYVEVEVDSDAVDRARPFVEALEEGTGLRPAPTGKLAAALAASGASPGWEPRPLGPMTVDRLSTLAEVAYAALRRDFLRLVEHEPVARLGQDILPPELADQGKELRWLGRSLGEARDLDVQRERFALAAPLIGGKAARAIEAIFDERHARAREAVLAALNSDRYVAMTEAMSDLLRAGPVPGRGDEPALKAALSHIQSRRRPARDAGSAVKATSPDSDYHALRLKVRDLRYVLEFFSPLGGEPAEAYIRQVTRLQTLLGDHQDAVIAAEFYAGLEKDEALGKGGLRAAAELSANAVAEAEGYRWKFPKRYARLRGRRWHTLKGALSNS